MIGNFAFTVATLHAWNSLLDSLCRLGFFQYHLKTRLFNLCLKTVFDLKYTLLLLILILLLITVILCALAFVDKADASTEDGTRSSGPGPW